MGGPAVRDWIREIVGDNHQIYFENYFTSLDLVKSMKKYQIFACESRRKDRKGLSKNCISDKKIKREDY